MYGDSRLTPSPEKPDERPVFYPASWIDGLTARIDRLPTPSPVFYVARWLVMLTLAHLEA
jgi:hypothetical protein